MSLSQADFTFVTSLVRQRSAIDLQPGKEYLIESRLAPVAKDSGHPDLAALVVQLRRGDDKLSDKVVDALTTNETSWFRDSFPFQAFSRTLLPDVATRAPGRAMTIWSAACSSGQEAYSLAMLSLEWMKANPGHTVKILGTDISPTIVEKARSGRYSQLEVNRGLPAKYLVEHFDQVGRDWVLREHVRSLTHFERGNLAKPAVGKPMCDIIFLRNVLIYFDLVTKRAVLDHVRRVLRPGGYLVLGGAESALTLDGAFQRMELAKAVVFQYQGGAA
jgi:chemotaxis protein methyltransferase CheR